MTPRKHLNHDAPHWVNADADYFITLCADHAATTIFVIPISAQSCSIRSASTTANIIGTANSPYSCRTTFIWSSDFPPEKTVAQVTGLWKHALARSHGITWQRNFFDHRLRNDENAQQKWDYVLLNPVRAGLIDDASKWPYTWMPNH